MKAATFGIDNANTDKFQSTPPVKAATAAAKTYADTQDISIHAAREGGDFNNTVDFNNFTISIHAAREGGDSGNE